MPRRSVSASTPGRDGLLVGNWLVRNDGRVRATRRFQIRRIATSETPLRGEIDYISIDLRAGRPRRMPDRFREAYRESDPVASALAEARFVAVDATIATRFAA
jgi:acyl-CoA thioester hydrolase